jgi:hypothetical protein
MYELVLCLKEYLTTLYQPKRLCKIQLYFSEKIRNEMPLFLTFVYLTTLSIDQLINRRMI